MSGRGARSCCLGSTRLPTIPHCIEEPGRPHAGAAAVDLRPRVGLFDCDPCPSGASQDGLAPATRWGRCNFVNPPYNDVGPWLEKAVAEAEDSGATSLFLIPARTWTAWFHGWVLPFASIDGALGWLPPDPAYAQMTG